MSGIAIFMMIISMATVWGGLVLAVLHLQRHPDEESGDLSVTHPEQ